MYNIGDSLFDALYVQFLLLSNECRVLPLTFSTSPQQNNQLFFVFQKYAPGIVVRIIRQWDHCRWDVSTLIILCQSQERERMMPWLGF